MYLNVTNCIQLNHATPPPAALISAFALGAPGVTLPWYIVPSLSQLSCHLCFSGSQQN